MTWTRKQLSTLMVVSVTSFMGTFLISSINIALPAIEKSFSLNAIELSWVITSFLLSTAIFMLPAGKWGDHTDNTKIYKIGLVIFVLASLFCAISPGSIWLMVARFFQGIGSALTNTSGQAILVAAFPPKNRGQVLGISVASVYSGLALGPFIGGMMTQHLGWQSLFYIATLIGVISIFIAFSFLEKDSNRVPVKEKINLSGSIVFMFGLSAIVYGSSQIPEFIGWLLMVVGVCLLFLFWNIERKSSFPLLDTSLFTHNKLFAFSNIAALINYTATFAVVFFLSLYLQKIQGLSPQHAGAIIISEPIVMALFSPIVGKLSDRIQPRYLATIGMGLCASGLFALTFLTATTPIWYIVAVLIWVGFGFSFFSSPNMNTIMGSVQKSQYGQASGLASSMRIFGQIVSMTIITIFFASLFKGESVDAVANDIFLTAIKFGFLTFALINLTGIYFSITRGNVKRDK